jgi:hypothetical protein
MYVNLGKINVGEVIDSTGVFLSSDLSVLDSGLNKKAQINEQNADTEQHSQSLNAMMLEELIQKNPDSAILLQWASGYNDDVNAISNALLLPINNYIKAFQSMPQTAETENIMNNLVNTQTELKNFVGMIEGFVGEKNSIIEKLKAQGVK